jgi:hypothetical protein
MSSRSRWTATFAVVVSAASIVAASQIPGAPTNLRITGIEPIIWGVTASNVTSSQATISWTTDIPSDSRVEYGFTTSYGSASALNTTRVTAHMMTLSGLDSGRLYHFRVQSRDAAGTLSVSKDYTFTTSAPPPPPASILWAADHEEGNMSDWYLNGGGNESLSGNAVTGASRDFAHTGSWSAKGTITTPPGAGARLFRKAVSNPNPATYAYYSAWYYIPVRMTSAHFNNIFQFKSIDSAGVSDPFWDLKIRNRSNGNMYVTLNWWCGLTVEGPHQGESGCRSYHALKDLPVGQWFHLEAFLRQSSTFSGQIIFWQDGIEIFNQNNVKTRYSASANDWSINNYGDDVVPNPFTIYFDDAAISSARLGPGTSADSTPPTVSLSAPAPGATVSSTVTVSASASDNVEVAGVQFRVDGANWAAEDTTAPFSMSWNSAQFANGAHSLSAVARDAAGNTAASAPVSVTVSNAATSCQTSGASWQNQFFPLQNGTFTATFDATPGGVNIDGVIGLAAASATTFTDLAAIARFNNVGAIDARNGGTYSALTSIPYAAGTTYRFRMVVNVPTHTYSVYVTPSGGSEQAVGLNYAFRSEQAAVNSLTAVGSFIIAGTLQLCNLTVTP